MRKFYETRARSATRPLTHSATGPARRALSHFGCGPAALGSGHASRLPSLQRPTLVILLHRRMLSDVMVKTLAFVGLVALGRLFKPQMSWLKLTSGGLLGAILFYLVTNTASWINDPGYAKTLAGWIQALTVGRPDFHPTTLEFFRNTLLSGGIFTALFVGSMKLTAESPQEKEAGARSEEEPATEAAPEEAKA